MSVSEAVRRPTEAVRQAFYLLRETGSLLFTDEAPIGAATYGDGFPPPPPVDQISEHWTVAVC